MLKAKSSSPLLNIKWSFLKTSKFWAIFVFFFILTVLPVALYEVQQKQTNQQHAAWVVPQTQTYYCNSALTVTLSLGGIGGNYSVAESPDCSTGFNKVSSFQSSVIIKQKAGSVGAYAVHWMWAQFWCQNPSTSPCLLNGSDTKEHVVGLDTAQNPTIVAQSDIRQAASPYAGQACGVYQNDFGFYITDNSDPNKTHLCTQNIVLTQSGLGNRNDNASWCNTNTTCTTVVNTPTPTPTHIPTPTLTVTPTTNIPTDTPTVTPTDIPSDTPSPTASPSATPTDTPAYTPTVTPTGTLTPTVTPTITPTGNPTATPVPPGSPTPTIIVVKPTLPPTGPSNTIMAVGLVGVAISVLGLALLIGI